MERKLDEKGGNEIPGTGGGVCSGWVEGHFFHYNGREEKDS